MFIFSSLIYRSANTSAEILLLLRISIHHYFSADFSRIILLLYQCIYLIGGLCTFIQLRETSSNCRENHK